MFKHPLSIPDRPLDTAIRALAAVTNTDDLRWLSVYIAIDRLNQPVERRGIDYFGREPGKTLRLTLDAMAELDAADLVTFRLVVDLLYKALRPTLGEGRGYVEIKTVRRDYPQYDLETGMQQIDDDGKPVYLDFYYPYTYVRLYAGKGDADHKRQKLLSLYADRGSGKAREGGGFGGWVARALADGLITEDQVLDAWHKGKTAYTEFVDSAEAMVKSFLLSLPDQEKLPGQNKLPNLF